MRDVTVYIGLGSNLDEPRAQIDWALLSLTDLALPGTLARSRLYRSEPLGPPGQADYLNCAVSLRTRAGPIELLHSLQALEAGHGRQRTVRWGARTLDLDLLLYGRAIICEAELEVPHPRIAERLFVLRPLQDLNPNLEVPGIGTVSELLDECPHLRLEPVSWDD